MHIECRFKNTIQKKQNLNLPQKHNYSFACLFFCATVVCFVLSLFLLFRVLLLISLHFQFPKADTPQLTPSPNFDSISVQNEQQPKLVKEDDDWIIIDDSEPSFSQDFVKQDPGEEVVDIIWSEGETDSKESQVIVLVVLIIMLGYAICMIEGDS